MESQGGPGCSQPGSRSDVPRITPKLKGLGIFTDISKPDSGFKIEVREYEVETVDELIQLANASRPAELHTK